MSATGSAVARPQARSEPISNRRHQMMEPLYVSGSPMWAAGQPVGFTFQTPGAVQPPVSAPVFSASPVPGISGGVVGAAQGLAAPNVAAANQFSYGGGMIHPSQAVYGLGPFGVFPYAAPSLAPILGQIGAEAAASSLLAAVALRRGQPQGPANDQEAEEFIYDALELVPGAADVDVRCEAGRATLTGSVQHKRVKREVGEIAWAISGLTDVQNNVTITSRRRRREAEGSSGVSTRKQS